MIFFNRSHSRYSRSVYNGSENLNPTYAGGPIFDLPIGPVSFTEFQNKTGMPTILYMSSIIEIICLVTEY